MHLRNRFYVTVIVLALLVSTGPHALGQTMVRQSNGRPLQQPPIQSPLSPAEQEVRKLEREWLDAYEQHDGVAMDRILADDFALVTGRGKSFTKADLLKEARSGSTVYEHQEDTEQTVRVWGDAAVVTALLWAKGTEDGKPFDYKLWFSDAYVRTPVGWRYVFGQASLPLPKAEPK